MTVSQFSSQTRILVSITIIMGIVRFADAALIVLAAAVAFEFYRPDGITQVPTNYYLLCAIGTLLHVIVFHLFGLYQFNRFRRFPEYFGRVAMAWGCVVGLLVVAVFLTKTSAEFSRGWTLIWFALGLLALGSFRFTMRILFDRWAKAGRMARRVAIVGGGEHGKRLLDHLNRFPESDIDVLGVFDDRTDRIPALISGHKKQGSLDELMVFCRTKRVDQIFVALPWSAESRVLEILLRLRELPVDVRLAPDLLGFKLPFCSFSAIGSLPLANVFDRPISGWAFVGKEIHDRLLALLLLLFVAPLLLGISLLIKLDSHGPVLFRQMRYGFNNDLIGVYKFRTMLHDKADALAENLATRDDPRVTRLGRFLRRSSLDELPQLINVLKGDMSLIGPRPHPLAAKAGGKLYAEVVKEYAARHRVKPGITGWAQVNGWRGETDTEDKILKRVEHDLYYIENWSPMMDIEILARTVWTVLTRRAAY